MTKQIALLIDNSGSMFSPVDGGGTNDKIFETSEGARLFIENLILAMDAGEQFAFSVHRFATQYEILPDGEQIDNGTPDFIAALNEMRDSIPIILNQATSQEAIGGRTDLYNAVRETSDYLNENPPSFGEPDARYILLFSDGIQTILHSGATDREGYEAEAGVSFVELLRDRNIRLRAWGIGSDTLALELRELTDQAVNPSDDPQNSSHPGSYTKVLFPESETGMSANCTAVFSNNATALVNDNGILPLQAVGGSSSGLLWEQFSLPSTIRTPTPGFTAIVTKQVNHLDFEVLVDGSTKLLILGLVSHSRRGRPTLHATSPSGSVFTPTTPGTNTISVSTAQLFQIPNPEEGTWNVRVFGDPKLVPITLDLMARGVFKEFNLVVNAAPFQLLEQGTVTVKALPTIEGKPLKGSKLTVTAHVLGGQTTNLKENDDGSFSGPLEITRPGINPIRVEVAGRLKNKKTIHRIEFTEVLLGQNTDPRFTVSPDAYDQGQKYSVDLNLQDAQFRGTSQVNFGSGIQVTELQVLNATTARAKISVASDAFVGEREVVAYNPWAEGLNSVRVREAKDPNDVVGRICCLQFNAVGKLVGVVLCDGQEICIKLHDERIQKLLEVARDQNLSVKITVDQNKCLIGFEVCRQ